jgi:hypothetical protein
MLVLTEHLELIDDGLLLEKIVLNFLLYEFDRRINRNSFADKLISLIILYGFKNMILDKKKFNKISIYDIRRFAEMKLYSDWERLNLNHLLEAMIGRRELFEEKVILVLYLFIDFEEIVNSYIIKQEKKMKMKMKRKVERINYERNYF